MLTKKQLKQLRQEIILNSLYLNDYDNTLFIKNKTACSFFDSYIEYLYDIAGADGFNSDDVIDVIDRYDNINNLYNYYMYSCCDGYDPLLQDDYIATAPINNSDSIVIYDYNDYDNYVYVGCHYLSGLYTATTPIKKYKLYDSIKNGYYFIKNKRRYYINNFMRCDYGRGY